MLVCEVQVRRRQASGVVATEVADCGGGRGAGVVAMPASPARRGCWTPIAAVSRPEDALGDQHHGKPPELRQLLDKPASSWTDARSCSLAIAPPPVMR